MQLAVEVSQSANDPDLQLEGFLSRQTERQTDSDTYEPTRNEHRWVTFKGQYLSMFFPIKFNIITWQVRTPGQVFDLEI